MPNKIYIAGRNQTKTVTPSNIQQTIEADTGYNALDAVVVNPIKAAMPQTLEQFIMRDDNMEPFSLNLDGKVPSYACYQQKKLVAVYGTPTSIRSNAFRGCTNLQEIDCRAATSIEGSAFQSCSNLQEIDCRAATSIEGGAFQSCTNLQVVDCRATTAIAGYSFDGCTNLQFVDIRNSTQIGSGTFRGSDLLQLVDITNSSNTNLGNTSAFSSHASNLTILVADATDKAHYQSATNWSAFAQKIKTVAEYEQQIGMSYDDYYEIIFGHPRFDTQEASA